MKKIFFRNIEILSSMNIYFLNFIRKLYTNSSLRVKKGKGLNKCDTRFNVAHTLHMADEWLLA